MSRTITELLNGGIVTARVGALLDTGELQRADDCVYREKDPALWRAPGRTSLNASAVTGALKGLVHCSYERSRTDQLIVYAGTTLLRAPISAGTPPTLDPLTFVETSSPGQVAGTISGTTTFDATTGSPFLADAVGANIAANAQVPAGTYVTAVSVGDGLGHFSRITLSQACTNAGSTLTLDYGVVYGLQDGGTEILDAVQFGTAYYTWFGNGPVRRLSWRGRRTIAGVTNDDTLVARPAGLDPVRVAPTYTVVAGSWNKLLGGDGAGYYWFLITEMFAPGGDVTSAEKDATLRNEVVESAYLAPDPVSADPNGSIGRPIAVNISAPATQGVQITFPAVTNAGASGRIANNWAVYMYGPLSDGSTAPSLAQLRRVATTRITTYAAGATLLLSQSTLATQVAYAGARLVGTTDGKPQFLNDTNMLGGPNRSIAYAVSGAGTATSALGVKDAVETLGGFVFNVSGAYATATIVGIMVDVTGVGGGALNFSGEAGYYIRAETASKPGATLAGSFKAYGTISHGNPLDTLGVNWVIGDLSTSSSDMSKLVIRIGKTGTGSAQRLGIDAVAVRLFFNSNTINLNGPAYRVVTYRDQIGLTISDPVNLPPPEASTGDAFQGMLVLNDLSDETAVRYSLPGTFEAFPKPYVLRINSTKRHDRVTFIRALGQVLIVGLENSIERVNYLPRETSTDLNDGLAHEPLTTDHGIPGPLCAATLDMPGRGIMLVYASASGMFLTNGIWTIPLNVDLDWGTTVKLSALSSAVLRIYPKEKWVALYYCPAGATHNKNTRVMYFCYQADKLKGEYQLPAIGPCIVSARSACEVFLAGRSYLLTGHESDGHVYWEDNGVSVPAGYQVRLLDDSANGDGKAAAATDVRILPFVRTRKFYPITIDRDGFSEKAYVMFSAYGATLTANGHVTAGSTTVTGPTNAFASVLPGMRVRGSGVDPGTIVQAKTSNTNITLSRAGNTTVTGNTSLTFDTGTIGVSVRGSSLGEAVKGLSTDYRSTLVGDLVAFTNGNMRRGFELQIEKVPLTFDSNGDTLTWADLAVNMRLHNVTLVVSDSGMPDTNRSVA